MKCKKKRNILKHNNRAVDQIIIASLLGFKFYFSVC